MSKPRKRDETRRLYRERHKKKKTIHPLLKIIKCYFLRAPPHVCMEFRFFFRDDSHSEMRHLGGRAMQSRNVHFAGYLRIPIAGSRKYELRCTHRGTRQKALAPTHAAANVTAGRPRCPLHRHTYEPTGFGHLPGGTITLNNAGSLPVAVPASLPESVQIDDRVPYSAVWVTIKNLQLRRLIGWARFMLFLKDKKFSLL